LLVNYRVFCDELVVADAVQGRQATPTSGPDDANVDGNGTPMPAAGHIVLTCLGFGIVAALVYRVRGRLAIIPCSLAMLAATVAAYALPNVNAPVPTGVLSFLLGVVTAIIVGRMTRSRADLGARPRRMGWLAAAVIFIGVVGGWVVFGIWYWRASVAEMVDAGWFFCVFTGFGFFAGGVTAVALLLLDGAR
jgi:hypothetical protein